jgi:hypothetical protein
MVVAQYPLSSDVESEVPAYEPSPVPYHLGVCERRHCVADIGSRRSILKVPHLLLSPSGPQMPEIQPKGAGHPSMLRDSLDHQAWNSNQRSSGSAFPATVGGCVPQAFPSPLRRQSGRQAPGKRGRRCASPGPSSMPWRGRRAGAPHGAGGGCHFPSRAGGGSLSAGGRLADAEDEVVQGDQFASRVADLA